MNTTASQLRQTRRRRLGPRPTSAPACKVHGPLPPVSGSQLCPPPCCLRRAGDPGYGNSCPSSMCLPASETSSPSAPLHWSCLLGVRPSRDPFTITVAGFQRSPQSAWSNRVRCCDNVEIHSPRSLLPPHPGHREEARPAFTGVRAISPSSSRQPASPGGRRPTLRRRSPDQEASPAKYIEKRH